MTENTENTEQKPAKKVYEAGTNSLRIPWPQDPQGTCSALRDGGVKAANRVQGDKDKLERLIAHLRLIESYAKNRFKGDTEKRVQARENAVSARERIVAKQKRKADEDAARHEAKAKKLREQFK